MLIDAEEPVGSSNNGIIKREASGFHGDLLSPDTTFLYVQEDCDGSGGKDLLSRDITWDGPKVVPELHILEAELDYLLVWTSFGVFVQAEVEEGDNGGEVGDAELVDNGCGLGNVHDEAKGGGIFFAFGRWVNKGVVAKLVGEAKIK